MLRRVISFVVLFAVAGIGANADTIYLKNGRKIVADSVRENGNRYQYDIGEDTYAIPKSSVDRIEAGGMPVHSSGGAAAADASQTGRGGIGLASHASQVGRGGVRHARHGARGGRP